MSLSKPIYRLLGLYFEQLHSHPMRTKSISSSLAATVGNITSQYISGVTSLNYDSVLAFGLYGLLFGNTLPNVFYHIALKLFPGVAVQDNILRQLLIERLLYTPLFVAVCLYIISRLQIHTTDEASKQVRRHFWPALRTNWLLFTLLHYAVLKYGPEMIRVPLFNAVEYFWYIYLAHKLKARSEN